MNLKLSVSVLIALMTTSAFAEAAVLNIKNRSSLEVSLGEYRGTKIPSFCETGFCFEEINVKFRPYSGGFGRIKGLVSFDLDQASRTPYLVVGGREPIGIADLCQNIDEDQLAFIQEIDDVVRVVEIKKDYVCLKNNTATIVVD